MNIKEIYDISNDSLSDDTLSEILDMNSDFEHSLYDKLIGNNGIKSIYPLYQDDLFEKVKFTSWVNLIIENSKDKKVLKKRVYSVGGGKILFSDECQKIDNNAKIYPKIKAK